MSIALHEGQSLPQKRHHSNCSRPDLQRDIPTLYWPMGGLVRYMMEKSMAPCRSILIADRNPHVRTYLMREMMAAGYRVKQAATGESVLKIAHTPGDVDAVILDPDLPGVERYNLIQTLRDRVPRLPIVLHTHGRHEGAARLVEDRCFMVIEKAGDSIERIKEAVGMLLPSCNQDIAAANRSTYREGGLP